MASVHRDFVISDLLFHASRVVTSSSPIGSFGRIERSVKFGRWKNIREHQSQRDKSWKSQTIRYRRLWTFRREPSSGKLIVVSNYKLRAFPKLNLENLTDIGFPQRFRLCDGERSTKTAHIYIYIVYILRLRIRLDSYVTENSYLDVWSVIQNR